MKLDRRAILALGAFAALPATAQVTDINDAINKAGRQRMLSQRVVKAYMALGLQVQQSTATKVLDQSMALFDRQLVELKTFAPAATVRETYTQLENQWSGLKGLLVGAAPSVANAAKLLAQDSAVLALANTGTQQLEQIHGKPAGKLVNLAGRQRMLSQRMAKYYLASTWGVETGVASGEIAKARTEFAQALETLRNAPEATPDILQELSLADGQWVLFSAALNAKPSGQGASNVFITSENLLAVMDKVTGLYSKLQKT
ncbi:type IV pili methyl-accepting chemotaxis transducer N-terminal domain-containing protein [Curvibacter sp. APW13]|uniref:type IV pili methyl-accepting chemotaxis transducer N-terminal domain-containing protein n=1 Tax=Curvibacter sp. APW13 TaxID=3077236 RepID=UPI0028DD83AB|nr:type IV pili methyl-accepting chemotaxis transducer N-terminal domain-containing protein [Curvibacter sp. APW13]MDT8991159.1 type IV pili methyl-accepting chemotaxis transducer N-terminal domain-containing protein [Curvibacter sp. APW13]